MRLYLSSYRIGDRAGALLALLGNGKRAAIIANGLDHVGPQACARDRRDVYDPHAELASLGIAGEDLDLRHYFGQAEQLAERLSGFDLVWVVGGNAFVLRRAMFLSGFDRLIVKMLDRDDIVYGGFSAGAVIAAPSLRGMELMDDPAPLQAADPPQVVWEGLGLVDYAIVPHHRSAHPKAQAAEATRRYFAARRIAHRTLADGEVIVWTGPRLPVAELQRIA